MKIEGDLSYMIPTVLFSVNALVLLAERSALVRKYGCKEQPVKSRYIVRLFVVNFIPGLGFVYRMTVRYVASV